MNFHLIGNDAMSLNRRDYLKLLGAGAAVAASAPTAFATWESAEAQQQQPKPPAESPEVIADRERRMKWWHEAKFGMFIHWGCTASSPVTNG